MPTGFPRIARGIVVLLAAAPSLAGCGKKSLADTMSGTYATESVQAELEGHERDVIGDDLHGRFDSVDRAEAEQEGAIWARLRLRPGGRFEYEGPVVERGKSDARLDGRWTAREGFVDLAVERASAGDAESLAKQIACPATPQSVVIPFLDDPKTGSPLRLARR